MSAYIFNFSVVFDNADRLLRGAANTLLLSVETMALGLLLAAMYLCAVLRQRGGRLAGLAIDCYVEAIRNTPLVVQLFIIYFGLPEFGLRMNADIAALLGMTFNLGAYASEILRAGIDSIPRTQLEAGRALGLRPLQIFRFVILVPALRAIFPALAGQFVMIMLGSSVVSTISAEELTAAANAIQTETFRPFEVYIATAVLYGNDALLSRRLCRHRPLLAGKLARLIHQFTAASLLYLVLATRWTLVLSAIAFAGGAVGGLVLALLRISAFVPARLAAGAVIQLVQGIPLLLLLFLAYFGVSLVGLQLDAWTSVSLAMTLYASAFLGDIWRGCIEAVHMASGKRRARSRCRIWPAYGW